MWKKRVSILYKQCGVNIGPYKTGIKIPVLYGPMFKLLKFNMNLQFVRGVYAMLTYLTCNERTYEKGIKGGLWKRY